MYIERKAALDAVDNLCVDGSMWGDDNHTLIDHAAASDAINEIPAVDPVHAAGACYCFECLYAEPCKSAAIVAEAGQWYDCMHDHGLVELCRATDFCSYGEAREKQGGEVG